MTSSEVIFRSYLEFVNAIKMISFGNFKKKRVKKSRNDEDIYYSFINALIMKIRKLLFNEVKFPISIISQCLTKTSKADDLISLIENPNK